jgi:hypothetical protein
MGFSNRLLFSPNFGNPVFYLLLKNFNQLLIGVDQFLLLCDLSNDYALDFFTP